MHIYKFLFLLMFTSPFLHSFEEGFISNNGVDIAYRVYGSENNKPILLVQGLGGQLINWPEHLIDFLIENNFRPIVFDNRDTGLSSRFTDDRFTEGNRSKTINSTYLKYYLRLPINPPYTLDDMATDAIKILDKLNIDKAHLLGISMGGMIAQIIAANHSDRINTFTLIASSISAPSPLNGPTRDVRRLLMKRSANPYSTNEERIERSKKIFKLIGLEGYDLDTEEFYNKSIESIERAGPDDTGFSRQIMAILGSKNRIKKVKSIKAKTLIIHGKEDPLIKVKNAYKTNKYIKNSNLLILPKMRHLIEPPVFDLFKQDLLTHLNNN
ncbi:alpha/beta hydrolase [Gammaproteobacteria bacterium]|nr:alpha/beta hydrolase [Gammaproteobacteria bacterium]MDA9575106.1 alpha/beta hydrolase [Gammaproteobacteria bacterium]MDB2448012.1 alpha/beta hydrolase [Gammaproteobacteria bacterium]MDC0348382.1 alpha/beta hydrolase [Gammaproteobacteria bacterium]